MDTKSKEENKANLVEKPVTKELKTSMPSGKVKRNYEFSPETISIIEKMHNVTKRKKTEIIELAVKKLFQDNYASELKKLSPNFSLAIETLQSDVKKLKNRFGKLNIVLLSIISDENIKKINNIISKSSNDKNTIYSSDFYKIIREKIKNFIYSYKMYTEYLDKYYQK